MHLIIGLGNPGPAYARTRHNLGWMLLDTLASLNGARFAQQKKLKSTVADIDIGALPVRLAKPQTYMNESGEAVRLLTQFYHLQPSDIWIVSDDINLPLGAIRIRHQGSSGGHNGLASVIEKLGSDTFHRLRIGVGSNRPLQLPAEDYVLQPFSMSEQQQLPDIIEQAIGALTDELKKNTREATGEG